MDFPMALWPGCMINWSPARHDWTAPILFSDICYFPSYRTQQKCTITLTRLMVIVVFKQQWSCAVGFSCVVSLPSWTVKNLRLHRRGIDVKMKVAGVWGYPWGIKLASITSALSQNTHTNSRYSNIHTLTHAHAHTHANTHTQAHTHIHPVKKMRILQQQVCHKVRSSRLLLIGVRRTIDVTVLTGNLLLLLPVSSNDVLKSFSFLKYITCKCSAKKWPKSRHKETVKS